jgi:uncharacterized phage protein gp47/JayE
LNFTGTANATILEGTRFETATGIEFALTENVTLNGSGVGSGVAVALDSGVAGNVLAGAITVQSEPSANITSVTNSAAATGGREEETDTELLNRMRTAGASLGSGTPDAIISDLMSLSGVRAANIIVNNEPTTVNGMPPHSSSVYVLGGDGQEIATSLFGHYVGLKFNGTSSFSVKDISGNSHTIAFTPATEVNIFSNVTLTTDNTFETTGTNDVKNAIVQIIGGTATDGTVYTGLNMGEDVIYSKLLAAVSQIQGVIDVTLTIGKAAGTQAASNIAINTNEVAQINHANITVTV